MANIKKYSIKSLQFYKNKRGLVLFVLIFLLFVFLRLYQLEERNGFGWDQVDNAWAAKNIVADGKFPLVGMQAKLNSGIFIGPLYYYYIAVFYFVTDLDPIASGIAAGFTGIITFFVIYFVTKSLFSEKVAFIAVFLYTISYAAISADRVQWPVNFILPISLLIFHSLYKVVIGQVKYILLLVLLVGLSFNTNFTAVFYPLIILLCLPLFPRTKEIFKYMVYSIPIFLIVFSPILVNLFRDSGFLGNRSASYFETYYHGLHLRRVFQLTKDAFIQFEQLLYFPQLKYFGWVALPLFAFIYIKDKITKEKLIFVYLCALWFFVPWLIFSLYSGEISDYYFQMSRPIALLILSYFLYRLIILPFPMLRIVTIIVLFIYTFVNLQRFWIMENRGLKPEREQAIKRLKAIEKVEFKEGDPQSYLYYIYRGRYEE